MSEKNFYFAIDLGTTNSVMAYGNIVNDRMNPIVLELDRKNDTGSTSRSKLLPSVVFYYKNKAGEIVSDVGDYAKSRYGTINGYVCKSVKSLMGVTDRVPLVDEIVDKTPADVSGRILSYMLTNAQKRLMQSDTSVMEDVIITVPASFDSNQCQATIDAAKKAGINVDNVHDILLYEPKAVIYDFIRMQNEGEISQNVLSLDTDKNIMVFDLGGGTLDVTLHRVGYTEDGILNIKDLAISRYTLLGGDNFDELIAEDMLKRFEEENQIKVSIKRRDEVMCKLRKLAERLKVDLSMAYFDSKRLNNMDLPNDYEFEVMDVNLHDAYAFETVYTKQEIEEIVAPLLGYEYKISDVDRMEKMGAKDVDNIIYPILDVLDKAGKNVKIDAVILNGGMTKFYMIHQRLKDFFGFEPLETSDPDLSVAKGAVYYHYCLHKYDVHKIDSKDGDYEKKDNRVLFSTSTILNDSVNLGLKGEYVDLLIPAGTELPYRSEEISGKYKLDETTSTIGIELFLGRGETKNIPNRRVASRTVEFDKEYYANTPLSLQMYINQFRLMTMEIWITGRPGTKRVVKMDMATKGTAKKTPAGISLAGKMRLNAQNEINMLRTLAANNNSKNGFKMNSKIMHALNTIKEAANPEDFFDPCYEQAQRCLQSDMMLGYMYSIGVFFKDRWSAAQKNKMLVLAKRHLNSYAISVRQTQYVMRKAIELIAAFDPDFVDCYKAYLDINPNSYYKQIFLQNVALYEQDEDKIVDFFDDFFEPRYMNIWIAQAFVKRYGRGTPKDNQQKLFKLVKRFAQSLDVPSDKSVPVYVLWLIAEMCSQDEENPIRSNEEEMETIWQLMEAQLKKESDPVLVSTIENIWNGTELTGEEMRAIVDLRHKSAQQE